MAVSRPLRSAVRFSDIRFVIKLKNKFPWYRSHYDPSFASGLHLLCPPRTSQARPQRKSEEAACRNLILNSPRPGRKCSLAPSHLSALPAGSLGLSVSRFSWEFCPHMRIVSAGWLLCFFHIAHRTKLCFFYLIFFNCPARPTKKHSPRAATQSSWIAPVPSA